MNLRLKSYLACFIGLLGTLSAVQAQDTLPQACPPYTEQSDTTAADTASAPRKQRGKFSSLIYNTITANPRKTLDLDVAKRDKAYLKQYEGKKINNIYVYRNNVFDGDSRLWLDRVGNAAHVVTRERQIRKDLLFKQGDKLNPETILNNRQLIRSRNYIADVNMIIKPSETDTSQVDVYVLTRDKWTISADANIRGDGESYLELYDDNIMGWGTTLSVRTYFNWKKWSYGGNLFEYRMVNILGTFFNGRIVAGKGFDEYAYGTELQKQFIKPADFAGGVTFLYKRDPYDIYPLDTTVLATNRQIDIWGGKSFYFPKFNNSLYFTARYFNTLYKDRPEEVSSNRHPYFHNEAMALAGIGLYQERFLTTNRIYGYGVTEYIAYGYRFGLTAGYSWGEFGDRWYMGGDFGGGYFTRIGYFGWGCALGSYLNRDDQKFFRTALTANVNWFSNLWGAGRYQYRQFVSVNGTRGWNRLSGYRETLGFTHDIGPRGLRDDIYGINRLVMNSETVIFTPWHVAQFKLALFGFADIGLIGDNGNMFDNNFYTTLGVGVRIKNEKLVFNTINIRLGIALNRHGFANAEYFRLSSEDKLNPIRYIPGKPIPVDYK